MKKSCQLAKTTLIAWLFVLTTNAAHATIVRDQGRIFMTDGEVDLGTDFFSQSITVGISGGLAAIEIQIGSPFSRTEFSIYNGGNPVTTLPLITETIDFPSLGLTEGDIFRWELPTPLLHFAEGQVFSFGFQAEVAGQRFAANDSGIWEDYAGGELFKNGSRSLDNDDVAFITYVDTTVVPIPPALWLFGSGLLGLIGIAKHKNSA
jgi:hypothetical protein